jgi:hypothetical protein
VDQINIIARWIHHHSDDEERSFFPLPEHLDDEMGVEEFVRHVTTTIMTDSAEPATEAVEEIEAIEEIEDPSLDEQE